MNSGTARLEKPFPYQAFLPLFFSLAGWPLLHAWLYLMSANRRAHVLSAALGLVLSVWSALPFCKGKQVMAEDNTTRPKHARRSAILGGVLVVVVGVVLGMLAANGKLFLFAASAVALNFAPWARLPLVRRHAALACAIALGGFAAAMLGAYRAMDVMFLPLATWTLWLSACIGLILRTVESKRFEHIEQAKAAAGAGGNRPAICDT